VARLALPRVDEVDLIGTLPARERRGKKRKKKKEKLKLKLKISNKKLNYY